MKTKVKSVSSKMPGGNGQQTINEENLADKIDNTLIEKELLRHIESISKTLQPEYDILNPQFLKQHVQDESVSNHVVSECNEILESKTKIISFLKELENYLLRKIKNSGQNDEINILVIDDAAIIRKILHKTLTELGYKKIFLANNGLEGISILNHKSIDIIILDWFMPEIDGYTFLNTVNKTEKFKKIPKIMISSNKRHDDILKAMKLGVVGYIVKPFNKEQLVSKLNSLLLKSRKKFSSSANGYKI